MAMPLWMIASIRILMSYRPNFQHVRSRARSHGPDPRPAILTITRASWPPSSTTVASMLPVWSSPGRVREGRSVDVCCGLVGLAGRLGTRTGGAQGADRTGVRQGRNTGDRWSFSRRLAVWGYAQDGLASG